MEEGSQAALSCEALVIGAGPAGAAAARTLAVRGVDVILVDRHSFPRDKVCGDALIPDALAALDRLGLKTRVLEKALRLDRIRIYAPNGRHVELQGELACLPRAVLDDVLRESAVEAGARFMAPLRLAAAVMTDAGVVAGARFMNPGRGTAIQIGSRFTILATGGAAGPLQVFSVCERERGSADGVRAYYRVHRDLANEYNHLCISYDRQISPGYGWIFPGPADTFNVGVGVFHDGSSRATKVNLRELLHRFVATFPPARRLAARASVVGPLRGAPLRTALCGARLSRPGLFVAGEAAGTTYSFSGEGIGKAMESGIIAAEAIAESHGRRVDFDDVARSYSERITREFGERFRAYGIAQQWLASARVPNFLVWRANRGCYVRRELEKMLTETGDPRALFSVTGSLRALLR